ncbi:MAG: ATP-binding cassette domain-containing protein [Candidatus Izemoplasmataceae bacterium]
MLSLNKVFKTYRNGEETLHALNNVSIQFNPGDFAFILGASGSGKSTLLNVLSGLDEPSNGHVSIDGIDTKQFSKKEWAIYRNHYVGFIFQEYNLIDHLSILDNVAMPLMFQGILKKEAHERALVELEKIGLAKHVNKKPQQLSGGQQQRVSIARALVTNPKVIMADEPTGALDEEMGLKILSYLKEHAADKIVIVVTHDEDLANTFSNRTIRIADGKIIKDTNERPMTNPRVNKLSLKAPRMKLGMLFKFAKNNLFSRMARTLFTASIVSIGFVSILLLTYLILGLTGSIKDSIGTLIPPDEYQVQPIDNINIEPNLLNEIKALDNVNTARYAINEMIYTNMNLTPGGQSTFGYAYFQALPVDLLAFERNQTFIGDYPTNGSEVIINLAFATQLLNLSNVDEDSYQYVFDRLNNRTITMNTVSYELNEAGDWYDEILTPVETLTIVGIVYQTGTRMVYMDYEALINVLDTHFEESSYKKFVTLTLVDTRSEAVEPLIKTLRDDYRLSMQNLYSDITTSVENTMFTALKWFIGISLITLVVSSVLIGLVVYTSVLERTKEIGILTAIGARHHNIRTIFLIESGISGLMSSLIATGFSIFIALGLNRLFNNIIQAPLNFLVGGRFTMTLFQINGIAIFLVVLFSIVYAMASGLIPSNHAAKMNAIKALRRE